MRGRRQLILLVVGWALLTTAWVIGNPPFEAPDEGDHYIRAVGVAQGDLLGRAAPEARIGSTERQIARTRREARTVTLPAGQAPPACIREPRRPASCTLAPENRTMPVERITVVGTYQPLPYLVPAAVIEAGHNPSTSLGWARAAGAATAMLFLALAAALTFTPERPASLLGPMAAVTPMVLFVASALNGSGLETASGIAFAAGLLRLTRAAPPPAWAWIATGLAGAVLAAARAPGPVWVLLGLLLAVALLGPGPASRRIAGAGPAGWAAAAVMALGLIANRAWEAAHGAGNALATYSLSYGAELGVEQWWRSAPELVGEFGHLEYQLPLWITLGWAAVVLALGVAAWRAAAGRERLVLIGVAAAAIVLPFLFYVLVTRDMGFGMQGRHVLVVVAALPLLAGELLQRGRAGIRAVTVAAAATVLGFIQVAAFYFSSRRYAVGSDGPLFFVPDAVWSPPMGWWPVLGLAVLGGVAIAATGMVEMRERELGESV